MSDSFSGRPVPVFVENNLDGTVPCSRISEFVLDLPRLLFSHLEECAGPLLPSHQRVALVLEQVRVEEHVREVASHTGRPQLSRRAGARALVAKAVLNIPTRKDLVERLRIDLRLRRICGFLGPVPSESTFCRFFAVLAQSGCLDVALESAVKTHLRDEVFHHVSHDSTAIPGRERTPKPKKVKDKRQRSSPTPHEIQETLSWQECLASIPKKCDNSAKNGSSGHLVFWRGYKAHASVGDGGIPLAFFTSSASMHDSMAAIPLIKMVSERVGTVFYNLLDKAYQGPVILRVSESLEQVTIVPPKQTKKDVLPKQLTADRAKRFENRTTVERFNSDLKENHGGNFVFVRGHTKVHAHLMCGVLVIFGLRVIQP